MPLPERLKPVRPDGGKKEALLALLAEITTQIDKGKREGDPDLQRLTADWNRQVIRPCHYDEFRDYHSYISASEFVNSAFNQERYVDDLQYEELLAIIDFVCKAEGEQSECDYALDLLTLNFNANPSDLIYWPNEWFNNEDMLDVELSNEEIAAYLMEKSGRHLCAPTIVLKYPIPND